MTTLFKPKILFVLIAVCLSFPVQAQDVVRVTAIGSKIYAQLSPYIRQSALEDARRQAVRKVAGTFPDAKKRNFKRLEDKIFQQIDDFVIESAVQETRTDAQTQTYTVVISAQVDVGALDAFFIENSVAGNQDTGVGSDFGALFVARTEQSRKSFQTKTTTVAKSKGADSRTENTDSNGVTAIDSVETSSFKMTQAGGSAERKRDQVLYEANSELSENLASAVEEQLVNAGFEPMDAEDLADEFGLPYLEDIINQGLLRKNGSFPKKFIKSYKDAARRAG